MKRTITTLLLLFFTIFIGRSQVTVTNESNLGTCNGRAVLTNGAQYTSWNAECISVDPVTVVQSEGDTLINLCNGAYTVYYTDSLGSHSFNFTVGSDGSCGTLNTTITSMTNESSPGACDGSFSVTLYGAYPPITIATPDGMTYTSGDFTSLCSGTYVVLGYDAGWCQSTAVVTIGSDGVNLAPFEVEVSTFNATTIGGCDGAASITASGGTAPYNYLWLSDSSTTSSLSGLCAGLYQVLTWDNVGDSLLLTFVISDPGSTYSGGAYPDSTAIDTLVTVGWEDCVLDYTSISSAWVNALDYYNSDSVYVTWAVVDGNGTNYYTAVYLISDNIAGVYTLQFSIYCPTKSTVQYYNFYDQVYLNYSSATASLDEQLLNTVSIFPNPSPGNYNIDLRSLEESARLEVYSLNGQLQQIIEVLGGQIESLHLNGEKGLYFVKVIADNQQKLFKVVKQ